MQEFYYQIKGKRAPDDYDGFSVWVFPPIFSGKVSANNKKEAKTIICDEYGKQFPGRVLKEQLETNEFILQIEELKEGSHLHRLFEPTICINCGNSFYIIDKYNDHNLKDKSGSYCSAECKENDRMLEYVKRKENEFLYSNYKPVIYKITNKESGKLYIGKTTQIFTLRWYQHFFQGGDSKFHTAIRSTKVTDWQFEIQEVIELPEYVMESRKIGDFNTEKDKYISERERYWINHFDSINNGYNSI